MALRLHPFTPGDSIALLGETPLRCSEWTTCRRHCEPRARRSGKQSHQPLAARVNDAERGVNQPLPQHKTDNGQHAHIHIGDPLAMQQHVTLHSV